MKNGILFLLCLLTVRALCAREFQISVTGDDHNHGTAARPFRTISAAARVAQPGDVITVHSGVYRERISPPRGGTSDRKRIVYQAAPGETVAIKGSELVTNWVKVQDDVWKVTLPDSFFGSFNPYNDLIHGDWFEAKHREHHTGAVYLNGEWLTEAAKLDDVLKPAATHLLWFGQVDPENTTIWAQFKGINPNDQLAEINVRQTVFYPEQTGINYLTVRGFILEQAATPWAPPTAEQIGVIGTHWSKGWIIESNVVRYSACSGIALGKYGDQWDNTSANTAEGYVATINHALTNGWTRDNIGHHLVRNNLISHCEQAGIVGSLGAAFSTVTGNDIHDIHVRKLFSGAEMAGIKFHGAIDVQIAHNHIHRTCLGLWLDWMAQGSRVSDNLFHNNDADALVEVDHGPFLLDNNLFLSRLSVIDRSQGGAYVHNLFAGTFDVISYDGRQTPFLQPHSTRVAGYHDNPGGDDRYYNNLFVGRADLRPYDKAQLPVWMDGNVFLNGARPSAHETNALVQPGFVPAPKLVTAADGFHLQMRFDPDWIKARSRKSVTTKRLGLAIIPKAPFEQPDGRKIRIDADYFGQRRNESSPAPGPFACVVPGDLDLKVWDATSAGD